MLLSAFFLFLVATLTIISVTTLAWMLYAWRSPQQLSATGFPVLKEPRHSFSLLLPARHEEAVLERTLRRIAAIDHPSFEVVAIVGHDDHGTAAVAHKVADELPHVRVVVDENWPKNKPKALNTALPTCTGDVIGIFDAEDDVHPGLLRHVDTLLQGEGVDVVQSGVQLMNFWSNWYSVRNVLEYYFWFRSRLHFHANARFIPLGGNTVFMRTEVLRRYEGWDADCLAEDCEIGVRLSSAGHAVAVAYHPDMVTREETPPTFVSLMKQRTRWNQGFLQVLRRGEWRELATRRRRALALYTLAMPFLQSFTGLLIPVSVLSLILLRLPMPIVLFGFVPLMVTLLVVVMEAVGLSEFGELFDRKPRIRDYTRLIVGAPFYQMMLAYAALRAVWREYTGRNSWEKTAHVGAHLNREAAA